MGRSSGAFLPFECGDLERALLWLTMQSQQNVSSLACIWDSEVKWAVSVELRRSNVIHTLGLQQVTSSACVYRTLAYAFKVYFLFKDEEPSCGQLPQMG